MIRPPAILFLIAAILLAVVVCAPLLALPMVFVFAATAVALRRTFVSSDEQPIALAALVAFRGPPV